MEHREREDRDPEALARWATSQRRLIAVVLARTPEQRLADLGRAAAFFHSARRA